MPRKTAPATYPPEALAAFESSLRRRRETLAQEVERMESEQAESSGDISSVPIHPADLGTESFDRALSLERIESNREEIREIEEALERLRAGAYGSCDRCRRPIPRERLEAIPYARLCLVCKRKEEARKG